MSINKVKFFFRKLVNNKNQETLCESWLKSRLINRTLRNSPHLILAIANGVFCFDVLMVLLFTHEGNTNFEKEIFTTTAVFILTLLHASSTEYTLRSQRHNLLSNLLIKIPKFLNIFGFPLVFLFQCEHLNNLAENQSEYVDIISHYQVLTVNYLICTFLNSIEVDSSSVSSFSLIFNFLIWFFYAGFKHFTGDEFNIESVIIFLITLGLIFFVLVLTMLHISWKREKILQIEGIFKEILSNLDTGIVCLNTFNDIVFYNKVLANIFKECNNNDFKEIFLSRKIQEFVQIDEIPQAVYQKKGHFMDKSYSPKKRNSNFTKSLDSRGNRLDKSDGKVITILDAVNSSGPDQKLDSPKIFSMEADFDTGEMTDYIDNMYSSGNRENANKKRTKIYEIRVLNLEESADNRIFEGFKILTFSDVSQARRIHEYLEDRTFKNRLLDGFSHELYTPLNGSLTVLNSGMIDTDVPNLIKEKYLNQSAASLNYLKFLLNDITDYLKIETNQLVLELEEFDLIEMVNEVVDLIQPKCIMRNLSLQLLGPIIKRASPCRMCSDPFKLKRIIFNLLSNCIKYSFKGTLSLTLTEIVEKNYIQIEIEDSRYESQEDDNDFEGFQHIEKELCIFISTKLSKLLAPQGSPGFFTEKAHSKGVKYKIHIKNYFIDSINMGSESPFISRPNMFNIVSRITQERGWDNIEEYEYLTNDDADVALKPKSAIGRSCFLRDINIEEIKTKKIENYQVLIVDDDVFNITSLEAIISKWGVKCLKANNGKQALEILQDIYKYKQEPKYHLKLIFMDIMMPVMNGLECTETLRKMMDSGQMPVLPIFGCSANTSHNDIYNCREVGMNGFLAKPLTVQKVNEVLKIYF